MARHVFVLLLVAVCLLQVSCGRAMTPEEANRILGVERRFLLEAADLLARWRRSSADQPQLVEDGRGLRVRRDRLLARLNWTSGDQPQGGQRSGITTGVAGTTLEQPLPVETDHPRRDYREATQRMSTGDGPGWTYDASDEKVEVATTGEMVDLLRQEAPSAEDLHQLADEFRRIWQLHKLRFDHLDIDKDASDEK